ncbi:MAG: tetratricopeptide repeat protein [Anaerolineae bacterium]
MPKGMIENVIGGATAGTKLREMIRQLEIDVVNLKGKHEKILDILKLRDEIQVELQRLLEQNLNLKSEQTRVETCDLIMERQVQLVEVELKSTGGLAAARKQRNPPEELKYWFIDIPYYKAKAKKLKTTLIAVPIIAVIVVVLAWGSITLFGPKNVNARSETAFVNGRQYLERGDLTNAAREFESSIRISNKNAKSMTYLGVVYEKQGKTDEAKNQFTMAQNVLNDRRKYLMSLGQAYNTTNDPTKAEETFSLLIKTSPNYEDAYLARGMIYEAQGKAQEAVADYEKASTLAEKSGNRNTYDNALLRLNIAKKTLTPTAGE